MPAKIVRLASIPHGVSLPGAGAGPKPQRRCLEHRRFPPIFPIPELPAFSLRPRARSGWGFSQPISRHLVGMARSTSFRRSASPRTS